MPSFSVDFANIGQTILAIIRTVELVDVLDVALVTFLIYQGMRLVRQTRTVQIIKGVAFVLLAQFIATQFQFKVMGVILSNVLQLGFVALVVVFQPELRRALEQVGRTDLLATFFPRTQTDEQREREVWQKAITAICDNAERMSETKTGALVVIERRLNQDEIIRTGVPMDAVVNPETLGTIFFEGSPLHDGAVLVRDGRIAAAGCLLPLSPNVEISKEMGTRHRAALGISEQSDVLAVVVSEETGIVSVAKNGVLIRRLDRQNLYSMLQNELIPPVEEKPESKLRKLGGKK